MNGDLKWPFESDEEMDDAIDRWHAEGSGVPLHEELGMSEEDFREWVKRPEFRSETQSSQFDTDTTGE